MLQNIAKDPRFNENVHLRMPISKLTFECKPNIDSLFSLGTEVTVDLEEHTKVGSA